MDFTISPPPPPSSTPDEPPVALAPLPPKGLPLAVADILASPEARLVVFVGAGMSAESGVPTYRGAGGVWEQYDYRAYACQDAFEADPARVLDFHDLRRATVAAAAPHAGHAHLKRLQDAYGPARVVVVTANIDGLLQRAGIAVAAELHGSLWRQRCAAHGETTDLGPGPYRHRHCPEAGCGRWLRPAITWFGDAVDEAVFERAQGLASAAEVFVAVGTSGAVWPAAGIAEAARAGGARMVEVNPADNEATPLYGTRARLPASRLASVLA